METLGQLHTTKSVKGKNNSKSGKELVIRREIEGTPFTAVRDAERKIWFATIGKYRVSEGYDKYEELEKDVHTKPWDIITGLINVLILERGSLDKVAGAEAINQNNINN